MSQGRANFSRMRNPKSSEAPEVPHVDRQQLPDSVHVHAGGQPGIMNVNALDVMCDEQRAPALMGFAAIG